MELCEQLLWAFDFPLRQQSRIWALQRQTPPLPLLLLLPPRLTVVTGVDLIHVHKGSPTLGSPRRQLLLVCAMATPTNKGQSPMVMANWVCSHYWLSKQWSTDGGLASPTQLTLQTFRRLGSGWPSARVVLYITPSCAALALGDPWLERQRSAASEG